MLEISEVTSSAELFALREEWQKLVSCSAAPTPFQTWEWLSTWWEHYPSGKLWILLAREGQALVGILPLCIASYYGLPLRRVRFMGAPLSDYQEMLALPERAAACRDAFLAHIQKERRRWDLLDLADVRQESAFSSPTAVPGLHIETHLHRLCPYIPLAENWETFSRTLGKNLRANIGRRRRQLDRDFALTFDTATEETLPQAMEELFALHNGRWRRRALRGALEGARKQRFHHALSKQLLRRGWLRLHRLRLDGKTRAAFYCFESGGRVYYYLSGFDEALRKYSPGMVLMSQAVMDAMADRKSEFDLLRGDETYKYEWKARDRKTLRLIIGQRSLRSGMALAVSRIERFIEHHGLRLQRRLWGRK
jgi:CelD/BcsL family acetyltransferase involved in cellulose biosynthesis